MTANVTPPIISVLFSELDTDKAASVAHDKLASGLREIQQVARAAGHGFGHKPLRESRNAGWTDLDVTDNCRPSYDASFLRTFNPHVIDALIGDDSDRAPIGGTGMLGTLVRHYPVSDGKCSHDSIGSVAYPCPEVKTVQAFLDSARAGQTQPHR